jgi:hypothetical protein
MRAFFVRVVVTVRFTVAILLSDGGQLELLPFDGFDLVQFV